MIEVSIPDGKVRKLERNLRTAKIKLPRELSIVINATARDTNRNISKRIRERVGFQARAVKRSLAMGVRAQPTRLRTRVTVKVSNRLPLKYITKFGRPYQSGGGISYVADQTKGRGLVPGGFMGPKPGVKAPKLNGHAFKRVGRARKPIVLLMGPSPWGVFDENDMVVPTKQETDKAFAKQMKRRIRFNVLKKSGLI